MTRRFLPFLLVLLVLVGTACGRYLTTGVAVVNGAMISRDELDKQVATLLQSSQAGQIDPSDAEQRLAIERQVILQLVQQELFRQEAKRLKVAVSDAEADLRFQQIATSRPQELQQAIQQRGEAEVRRLIREQFLFEKVVDRAVGEVEATEQEVVAAYGNGSRFEEFRIRHILFLAQDPSQDAAAKRKAEETLAKIRSGADFAALARQVSEDPGSKAQGGDLGYVTRDVNFDEAFLNAALALRERQVSGLVRSQFGYHIIRLDDRRTKTLAQVRAQLTEQITNSKQEDAFQDYLTGRVRESDIVVNPRWGDFNTETLQIDVHEFFVPPSPEPETEPVVFR